MRSLILPLSGIIMILGLATATAIEPAKLRVVSYNIAGANKAFYGDPTERIEALANFIVERGIDVVGLQEVTKNARSSKRVDVTLALVKALRARGVIFDSKYHPRFSFNDGTLGNAVLSRYPITSARRHRLKNKGIVQSVEITLGAGTSARVFNFHPLPQYACQNIRQMEGVLADYTDEYQILLGDFNATTASGCLAGIEANYVNACDTDPRSCRSTVDISYHPGMTETAIDFVFVTPNINVLRVYSPRLSLSDHYPVVAVLGGGN